MGGNGVGGAVRERETLRVGEAIGRNRVRQIGEGRGKMPLVASHSDAHMQAKHTRAHADLQSRLLFIVSLLAKEITSGALNQINKVRGVSELSLLHLRILAALQWWAERKPTLNQRDIERAGHSRDYSFFSYCGFLSFHREQIGWPVSFGSFCHSSPEHFPCLLLSSFSPRPTKQGFFTGLYVGEQEEVKRFPTEVFWVMMLTHSFWTREEPDPTWAAQADATATDASLGFTSWYHPFSRPALQHVPFCEALPSLRAPGQCANGKWLRVPQPGSICPAFPCRCCSCSCVQLCLWPAMTPTGPYVPRGAPTPRRLPWWGGMCAATTTSWGRAQEETLLLPEVLSQDR